jgi:hypothetical protein
LGRSGDDAAGGQSSNAIAFSAKTEVRQLLTTINNAAKEAALKDQNLDVAFEKWWPDLEEKVQAISSAAQPPTRAHRSERDLLEEVVENTRTLVRELQALPPWQRFAIDPQVEATVQALLRGHKRVPGLLDLNEPNPSGLVGRTVRGAAARRK